MRFAPRVAVVATLVLAPLSSAVAQNAGKTLAMAFRMTNSVQGMPDTGVIVGHAVGTTNKMRLDVSMSGAGARLTPLADSAVSMIVTDSGKTITYLDSNKSQFLRVQPAEMVAQAQRMGGMRMDISGTDAKVENLGRGPVILGHPTSHYRVTTGMTMKITAHNQEQSVSLSSSTEYFYAVDIQGELNPFGSISAADLAGVFGASSNDGSAKLRAARDQLPKATPLRATISTTVAAQGATRITNTLAEVTSVGWVTSDPQAFEVPKSYTPAPGLQVQGATPPPK